MTFSVKDIRARYGVGAHTVLAWIRSGELSVINVGVRPANRKPRWPVTQAALEAFEAARTSAPPAPSKSRRRARPADIVEFY